MSVCRGGGSVESARETRYVAIASYPQKKYTRRVVCKLNTSLEQQDTNQTNKLDEKWWGIVLCVQMRKQTHVTTSFMSCNPVYSLSVALFMLWSRKTMLSSRKHWIGREMGWGRSTKIENETVCYRKTSKATTQRGGGDIQRQTWSERGMSTGKWERCGACDREERRTSQSILICFTLSSKVPSCSSFFYPHKLR